jgi:hypothetical protein
MMRRHELDPISLLFGLAFTGLGLLFLADRADVAYRLRWVWPVLLLAVGLAILLDLRVRGSWPPEAATAPPSASAEPREAEPSEPGDQPVEERDPEPEAAEAAPPSDGPERG